MGMSEEDRFEGENRNEEQMSYNSANLTSDWAFNGLNNITNSQNPIDNPSCSSTSMVDSFWVHQSTNSQNLLVPLFLPPNFQIPTDSGFIEPPSRFSCFGNLINPFDNVPSPYSSRVNGLESRYGEGSKDMSMSVDSDGSQCKNERRSESFVRSLDEVELRDDVGRKENSKEGLGSKRRRRIDQGKGTLQVPDEAVKNDNDGQQKGENNSNLVINKLSGRHGKSGSQASVTHKEEYIHVRARRGQATNSHSLAERVRREKISKRMKFLQDLVPGCSKVTGKAVMLDEIINYVQSLQKQVEFLSMKLATVNPRLDFNIEALLSKDLLQAQAGPGSSGALGFGHGTMPYPPPLYPLQTGIMQAGISGVGSSSDAVRRTIHSHLTSISGGYKNPTSEAL